MGEDDTIIAVGLSLKKLKQQKKKKALHDKVRHQASTMVNCREEVKILNEYLQDLCDIQQQDQECVKQEKKRVAGEEGHKAHDVKAVENQRKRTEQHNCFRKDDIAETRRLTTRFKHKIADGVEENKTEAIKVKAKTKQKLAVMMKKGSQSLVVLEKKAIRAQI